MPRAGLSSPDVTLGTSSAARHGELSPHALDDWGSNRKFVSRACYIVQVTASPSSSRELKLPLADL